MRRVTTGGRRVLAVGVVALAVAVPVGLWLVGSDGDGRGSAPLPPGAQALRIATDASPPQGPGCPLLGLDGPARIARWGDSVFLVWDTSGDVAAVVWPYGFSARLLDGRAEIVSPEGHVIGRDGDPLGDTLGLWSTDPDGREIFHICSVSGPGYRYWPGGE